MKKWRILFGSIVLVLSFVFVSAVSADTTYVVQYGDTLWRISRLYNLTPQAIAAVNPKITNINLIYAGDLLVIPGDGTPGTGGQGYIIRYGDTLYNIAWRHNTTVAAILAVNPQITNPNWIYAGQTLTLPPGIGGQPAPVQTVQPVPGVYIVQPGDGLTGIARRYGITVESILALNPQITNPHLIFVGDRITLPGG